MAWIDAHVHIWTNDTTAYPRRDRYPVPGGTDVEKVEANPPHFPPEEVLRIAGPYDVDRIGLVQMSFYGTISSLSTQSSAGQTPFGASGTWTRSRQMWATQWHHCWKWGSPAFA